MTIELDSAEFMDTTYGFAMTVTLAGAPCAAIFDNGYANAFGDIAGSQPALLMSTVAAGSATTGTAVTVNSTAYTVAERQDDGTGMTRLVLES